MPKIQVSALGGNRKNEIIKSKNEKMKLLRESTQNKFEGMRMRASRDLKEKDTGCSSIGAMGKIKTFGELSDSILKLRENFDAKIGKKQMFIGMSPLKKKDIINDFNLGATLKDQECETDEEETEIKPKLSVMV